MQCSACGAFIDVDCALCPYCGQINVVQYANTPPLIAAHDLPITYGSTDDAPFTYPHEDEGTRHAGLKTLLLLLIAAEMLIACLVLMTLADGHPSSLQPKSIQHRSGAEDARIALATNPIATLILTPQTIAIAPAIVVAHPAQSHSVRPTRPPTHHPHATPTLVPLPTARPQATTLPTPPSSTPLPTPTATATLTPTNTPSPTATPLPTSTPTPDPTQIPPEPTPEA